MKICLNKLFREPDLITLWMLLACLNKTIDGKAGSLWYNLNQESHKSDENQDPHIHKGVLVWHHDHNSEKTFFRGYGMEWACVLWKRMHVTGIGCDAVLNMTDALIEYLLKSQKNCYNRDTNRSMNVKASTSSCPRFRIKQMAEKQNRLIWSVCPSSEMISNFSECLSSRMRSVP